MADRKAPALMLASDRVKMMQERKNANKDVSGKSTKIDMTKKAVVTPKAKPKAATPAKPTKTREEFNKAFAAARKSGVATFTFNGKKYTTKLK
jgi:hypothetical protein